MNDAQDERPVYQEFRVGGRDGVSAYVVTCCGRRFLRTIYAGPEGVAMAMVPLPDHETGSKEKQK